MAQIEIDAHDRPRVKNSKVKAMLTELGVWPTEQTLQPSFVRGERLALRLIDRALANLAPVPVLVGCRSPRQQANDSNQKFTTAYGFVDESDPDELLSPEGWQTNGLGASFQNETIMFDPGTSGSSAYQAVPGGAAHGPYRVSITVDTLTQGQLIVDGEVVDTAGTTIIGRTDIPGEFVITGQATDAVISNVSLKALDDSDLGPELVTNGDFSSGTGWSQTPDTPATTPWVISGGVGSITDDQLGGYLVNDSAVLIVGQLYRFHLDVNEIPNGFAISTPCGDLTEAGSFTDWFVASSTDPVSIYAGYGVHEVDNLSVKKYTLPS